MSKTHDLIREIRHLETAAYNQQQLDFPVGSTVRWKHGQYTLRGQVVSHGYGPRLKVCGKHGKEYWIYTERALG